MEICSPGAGCFPEERFTVVMVVVVNEHTCNKDTNADQHKPLDKRVTTMFCSQVVPLFGYEQINTSPSYIFSPAAEVRVASLVMGSTGIFAYEWVIGRLLSGLSRP